MIKKTITYDDLDGTTKTEDFWFQITQAEFVKKAMTEGGEAYLEKLQRLAQATEANGKEVMATFEVLLRDAVGRREGMQFVKTDEIRNHFMFSGAYDAFFLELIQTPDSGATFMRGMLPKNAHSAIDKALAERGVDIASTDTFTKPDDATVVETVQVDAGNGGGSASAQPTPFPQSLEKAVEANQTPVLDAAAPQLAEAGKDDEPKWLQETRYPTQKELMAMPPAELQLAMKMKSSKAFG